MRSMYKIIVFGCLSFVVLFGIPAPATYAAGTTTAMVATTTATTTLVQNQTAIEKRVREYFADIPVMIDIARCESVFRQFTDSGAVFYGGGSRGMVGIFQFYEIIHADAALKRGFDLKTVEGNLGYARSMYEQSGTKPWSSCVPDVVPVVLDANKELRIKLLTKVVELLTELLKMKLAAGR